MKNKLLIVLTFLLANVGVRAQDYLDDVMFQSFGWDEYAQNRITSEGGLYEFYNSRAGNLKAQGFDMVWLPPPSASTGGVGYFPTEWFNFSKTSWGTEAQLRKMLTNMNNRGIYPIADVVVNHRSGTTGWVDFTNPTWGCETICSNDDAAFASYVGCKPSGAPDTGMEFGGSRDLDHTNKTVQDGVKDFLSRLNALGFKGWRWDVAKGFSPVYFGNYIQASQPYYSVGEFWDGNVDALKAWINGTYGGGANISGAFDFSLYYTLSGVMVTNGKQVASNNYAALNRSGNMAGLAGHYGFSEKAVTFVDNHDTFVQDSSFLGTDIPKAYAYILTHPGIPSVFAPHYYGGSYTKDGVTRNYSSGYATEINKLMAIRKTTGINAYSNITIDKSEAGLYAAYIKKTASDTEPVIAVKIGPYSWSPILGSGWTIATSGTDYAVWTKTAINVPPVITMSPAGSPNIIGTNTTVIINASDDGGTPTIRYTLDGSDPTSSSPIYTSPLTITTDTVVKAVAIDNLGVSSGVIEKTYSFIAAPKDIVVRFRPPTTTPNWPLPKIHYWNYTPTNALPAANWGTPINMVADAVNPGWFKYTFPSVFQVSFLFRDGNSTGTLGVTKTADIVDVTKDSWYQWDATSSTFVKEINVLATDDIKSNSSTSLKIMQNPVTNGNLSVSYKNAKGGNFYIYDFNGKLIKSEKVKSVNGEEIISVSGLKTGAYILTLKTDVSTTSSKFFVK